MAFPEINIHLQFTPKFTFGALGNIISLMVYLSPILTFRRIWRKKSTEGFESVPYLVTLFSSMLWLYYALLKGDAMLLITINSVGTVIEMVYIILYLTFADRDARKLTIKYFTAMNLGAYSLLILITHYALPDGMEVSVFGWICTVVSVCVFVSPLSVLRQVIRTKSVEFMPFSMSLFLTLGAVMWFGYGLFSHDKCVYIPNIIGFFLGVMQMILYVVYRRAEKAIDGYDGKLPEKHPDIFFISGLGGREVYPVVEIMPTSVDEDGQVVNGHPGDHNHAAKEPGKDEKEGAADRGFGPNEDSPV